MPLKIHGASEHNLKHIDVIIPEGIIAFTGVSGSGKSSLVYNTIYHESQRYFNELYGHGKNRLLPAKVDYISELHPMISIDQNSLNRNPNSILATYSGLHPFFRLLFARFGIQKCPTCGKQTDLFSFDEIVNFCLEKVQTGESTQILAHLVKNVRGSHQTLLQMLISQFDPNQLEIDGKYLKNSSPLKLDAESFHTINIRVAIIKNESTFKEVSLILHQIQEMGLNSFHLIVDKQEPVYFSFSFECAYCDTWITPIDPKLFNQSCSFCLGEGCVKCQQMGINPIIFTVTWHQIDFPTLLTYSVDEAIAFFQQKFVNSYYERIGKEILNRLIALQQVGLGYLQLNRSSPSLSRGESQRVRLALILLGKLEDLWYVLDEPSVGLATSDVAHLMNQIEKIPGTVLFIEHDRAAIFRSDYVIDIGPGSGKEGGQITFQGTLPDMLNSSTISGEFFSLRKKPEILHQRNPTIDFLFFLGCQSNNLKNINVQIPIERLSVITGPSGSGKSTLVENIIFPTLQANKNIGCMKYSGKKIHPIFVDQSPIGQNPRSNPATYTKLAENIRDLFANFTHKEKALFTFNRAEGACSECNGYGSVEVKMRYIPSTWIECPICKGEQFNEEVLQSRIQLNSKKYSIRDFLDKSISELTQDVQNELNQTKLKPIQNILTKINRILSVFCDIGLGYLSLGQASPTLSGGEAQRIKLVKFLSDPQLNDSIFILDEPSTGLHPADIQNLLNVFKQLVTNHATLLVVEHNFDIIKAADWIIDLGPESGPNGGNIIYMGNYEGFLNINQSKTVKGLQNDHSLTPKISNAPQQNKLQSNQIEILGARANNLRNVSVSIPKMKITSITGVSGSGKSSLISDILMNEAKKRYYETLSMYERQGMKEGPEVEAEQINGLGITLNLDFNKPQGLWRNFRTTVGSESELEQHLAVLMAFHGKKECPQCGKIAKIHKQTQFWFLCPFCHFEFSGYPPHTFLTSSYGTVCNKCHGIGTIMIPDPDKLIIHPEKSLFMGAMYSPGFFPKGYLCKPYNGGYYEVLALAKAYNFDPITTPWNEMTPKAQQAFLYGTKEELNMIFENKSHHQTIRLQPFRGFYNWLGEWDVGGTYSRKEICPQCGGKRFQPEILSYSFQNYNIHELFNMEIQFLFKLLSEWKDPPQKGDPTYYSYTNIYEKTHFLSQIGLGYLDCYRQYQTVSAGEAQRLQLAKLITNNLRGLTIVLDEPTRGLHPTEIEALYQAIKTIKQRGNTVIIVEHDLQIIRDSDYIIDMGPGAGNQGGTVVAAGTFPEIIRSHTITGEWLSGNRKFRRPLQLPSPNKWLIIHGARANNLKNITVRIPRNCLVGICGVSGSGKSTLIFDILGRVVSPKKQTTSVAYEDITPGDHDSVENAPQTGIIISQSKDHITKPIVYLDLQETILKVFSQTYDALEKEITLEEIKTVCSLCKGNGYTTIEMGFLPDVHEKCTLCQGTGLSPMVQTLTYNGRNLKEIFAMTLTEVNAFFFDNPTILKKLKAVLMVGLGYLVLNQPSITLSGGECQRLKIARELNKSLGLIESKGLEDSEDSAQIPKTSKTIGKSKKKSPKKSQVTSQDEILFILDEPTVGLSMEDTNVLYQNLRLLVQFGHSVLLIEHHPQLLALCDWIIELGPQGGQYGGYCIGEGSPSVIAKQKTPTAPYLAKALEELQ